MRAYVDSDILIAHLRGDPKALQFLNELQKNKKAHYPIRGSGQFNTNHQPALAKERMVPPAISRV